LACEIQPFRMSPPWAMPEALAPSFASLLHYVSLRGPYDLLASSLPTLPRVLLRHVPGWPVPRARHCLELFAERVETLGRCSPASWADVCLDRQFADRRKHRCGCCDRALGPGPGVRPGNLGD